MPELPIACALTPEQLEARRDELLPGLLRRARSYRDTAAGRVFEFVDAPGLLRDLARTLELERGCCRFLAFSLTLEPDGGPIRLEISGPEGTRQFLDSLDQRRPD